MEYVYAAIMLHEAEKEINEENLTRVIESTGKSASSSRVKALVAALEDVNLETVIQDAAQGGPASAPTPSEQTQQTTETDTEPEDETANAGTESDDSETPDTAETEDEETEENDDGGLSNLMG